MRRTIPLALLLLGACHAAPLAPAAAGDPQRDAGLAGSGYAKEAAPAGTEDGEDGEDGGGTLGSGTRAESASSTLVGSGYRDGENPGLGSGGG